MKRILLNWNFMRFLRLGAGIFILVQGFLMEDWMVGVIGGLFTLMPIFNIGCCAVTGCAVPVRKTSVKEEEISYEEVN